MEDTPGSNGSIIDATKPVEKSADEKLKEFLAWGHINFESDKGITQANCKAFSFNSIEALNKYFEDNPGMFAVQIMASATDIICLINRVVTPEEQQLLEDEADAMEEIKRKRREARADAAKAQADAEVLARNEVERLMEAGKKCESNHGAVLKDNDKLKREVKELKKAVEALKTDIAKIQRKSK